MVGNSDVRRFVGAASSKEKIGRSPLPVDLTPQPLNSKQRGE
ncbi:hypothetical protein [Nostoc sp.]